MKFYGILLVAVIFVTVQAENPQDKSGVNVKNPEILTPTVGQNLDNKDKNNAPCPPLSGVSTISGW